MKRYDNILELLDNSKGYHTALLSTFSIDIDFFERKFLYTFIKNGIRSIAVYCDANEWNKAVASANGEAFGRQYTVNPIALPATYHPKVILLLGDDKARLILGSANLTRSGQLYNNEVFNYVDYDKNDQKYRDIIYAAILFFKHSNGLVAYSDENIISQLKNLGYNRESDKNGELFFMDSFDKSIVDQVKTVISDTVLHINICAPYYDNELTAFETLKKQFPDATFNIFLQYQKSTFPENKYRGSNIDKVLVFDSLDAPGKENNHFYHGKVFSFDTAENTYILFGSSNCTSSALTKSVSDNGNYECDILVKGSSGSFNAFAESFKIKENLPAEAHLMRFESKKRTDYSFSYSKDLGDTVELYFSYPRIMPDVEIEYKYVDSEGEETVLSLDYCYKDEKLVATINKTNLGNTIFNVIVCGEIIVCWFIDKSALRLFRSQTSVKKLLTYNEHLELEEDDAILLENLDRITELIDLDDERAADDDLVSKTIVRETDNAEDDDESEDAEDIDRVVTVVLSDEDYLQQNQFRTARKMQSDIVRNFTGGRLQRTAVLGNNQNSETKKKNRNDKEDDEVETPEIIRRRSILLNRVRLRINKLKKYLENRKGSFEKCYKDVFYLLWFLDEPRLKFSKNNGLTNAEILDHKKSLLETLVKKMTKEATVDEKIISDVLYSIVIIHNQADKLDSLDEIGEFETTNKNMIRDINKKFKIKQNYEDILDRYSFLDNIEDKDRLVRIAGNYINSLFGFFDYNELQSWLKSTYGIKSGINIINGKAIVTIYSQNMGNPDESVLTEIRRYSNNVEPISQIEMTIKNANIIPSIKLMSATHLLLVDAYKMTRVKSIYRYKDGNPVTYNDRKQFWV